MHSLVNTSNQIYRITYEAFSKFSSQLNACRSLEEIAECFSVNLKYLFNFHIFRASYNHNDRYIHLTCTLSRTVITESRTGQYLSFEEILLKENRPMLWTDIPALQLPPEYNLPVHEEPKLWGWNFVNNERHIVASVLAGNSKSFSHKEINFLKLAADNLESKILEICLIKELDERNAIISEINLHQQEVIEERTREIAEKNKVLLEISVLNAHTVREPLSRILGLVQFITPDLPADMLNEIIPRLKTSSNDLDNALQSVIQRTTDDLLKLKV